MSRQTVIISQYGQGEAGAYRIRLRFPSGNSYETQVRDPFREHGQIEADQETRLQWYFERRLASPYTDKERAKRAAQSIKVFCFCFFRVFKFLHFVFA